MKNIYKCVVCGKYVEDELHCGKEAILLMDSGKRLRLSKLLSFILRHSPQSIKVEMDNEGWVNIDDIVYGIRNFWGNREHYWWVTEEHIIALVVLDPKGRFELKNNMVRARYGHNISLNIKIKYEEDKHVKTLYHGTSSERLKYILKEGIKPTRRKYVHLTLDPNEACETARKHGGVVVILKVNAECLRKSGYKVFIGSHHIRLVKYVPPECVDNVSEC